MPASLLASLTLIALTAPAVSSSAASVPLMSATESIFPDNDLWKEDCLTCFASSGVTQELFEQISDAAVESFAYEASLKNEKLVVNKRWTDPTVNANMTRTAPRGGTVIINMYGGLARRPEVNPASFALVVCHELGHAYAGMPFLSPQFEVAAEGMADYFAARNCYNRIYMKVSGLRDSSHARNSFVDRHCYFNNDACQSGLEGAMGLGALLSTLMREEVEPQFDTPDSRVSPQTLLSYPATAQCRLDTYVAGLFYGKKPACWYKSEVTN